MEQKQHQQHQHQQQQAGAKYRVSYIDSVDPNDLHSLLVWYFDDPKMMKLRSVPLGRDRVSFFYVRVPGMLMTSTERYLVVSVVNNNDPLFSRNYRRLSELSNWTSFQTRMFEGADLPLEASQIVQHEYKPKAARETVLQAIRLSEQERHPDKSVYTCALGDRVMDVRATLLPSHDRVALAKSGTLRDGLETFQCVLER